MRHGIHFRPARLRRVPALRSNWNEGFDRCGWLGWPDLFSGLEFELV